MVRPYKNFQVAEQFFHNAFPLASVDLAGCLHHGYVKLVFGSRGYQRCFIFSEAGSAPSDSRVQNAHADDIGTDLFRQLPYFIDVASLERQKRVRRVFN
jgi:hypothetical protein